MAPEKNDKIIIIDGSSYFFRAYYAIQRLSNSKGFPTNAIYGFINMLMRVLEVEKPTQLAIAFDTPKRTFRKDLYEEYKANREAPPEDLVVQIPQILRAVDCFGVKRLELEGFEADDIIGTLAKRAQKEGHEVDIITGDKDLMQLVNDKVTIYDSMRDKRYDPSGVEEKFGVKPHQVVDFLALMGDSSDNIPGVTGIGEKTAADLIRQFGSLDGIYEHLDEIKQEKRRETLRQERETAYLSQRLATVECDAPVEINWEEMSYQGPRMEELKKFLEEMEFRTLMKRFQFSGSEDSFHKGNYTTLGGVKELKALVEKLSKAEVLSVDTETTSLTIHTAKLVGISLCCKEAEGYYVPIGHHAIGMPDQLLAGQIDEEAAREVLRLLLEKPELPKIGQNLKYDLQILKNWGIDLKPVAGDTLLESYLVDPDQPHNLDALALRYLGHQNITYEEVTGKGRSQISFAEVSIEKATEYSGEDADIAFRLHQKLLPELKDKNLISLYEEIEVPLIGILASMEYEGILVNGPKLQEMSIALTEEMGGVEEKICKLAGGAFNINSPKQLSAVLFEKLKLPVVRKTKTGQSTDEGVLEELRRQHPICDEILRFRELGKLKSTYVDGLLTQIHPKTGRVHTSYNQTVTATGRLSSSNPNLQNIPTGGDSGYDIRSVFVAGKGMRLWAADYSQIELRLLADMSGDKELLRAFENDEDVHAHTARVIFHKQTITPEERKIAKTINFGVVYGQTPYGLSQTLKISPKEAKEFIDTYFEKYSGVKTFFKELVEEARKQGFVSTKLGRRRYLPMLNSSNRMQREMAERAAINAPLQGSAADLIKLAMIRIDRRINEENLKARMRLQVHDELVFEVPENEIKTVASLVRHEMENAFTLKIPLKVDIGSGQTWRECS